MLERYRFRIAGDGAGLNRLRIRISKLMEANKQKRNGRPAIWGLVCLAVMVLSPTRGAAQSDLRFSGIAGSVNHRICAAILEKVYADLGFTVSAQTFPAERALLTANSGGSDGEIQRVDGLSEVYPNLIKVPESIFFLEGSAFVKDPRIKIYKWDSLKSYVVGIPRGIKYLERNTEGMNRVVVASVEQLFYLLEAGRVEVVVISTNYGRAFLKKNKITDVKIQTPPIIKVPLYHYLHKKHVLLVPKVAAQIRVLKNKGVIDRIIAHYKESG